eukprot:359931-Chlamydomonas_euryale.AAC.1
MAPFDSKAADPLPGRAGTVRAWAGVGSGQAQQPKPGSSAPLTLCSLAEQNSNGASFLTLFPYLTDLTLRLLPYPLSLPYRSYCAPLSLPYPDLSCAAGVRRSSQLHVCSQPQRPGHHKVCLPNKRPNVQPAGGAAVGGPLTVSHAVPDS